MKNCKLVFAFIFILMSLLKVKGQGWVKEYNSQINYQGKMLGLHELADGYFFVSQQGFTKVDFSGNAIWATIDSNYATYNNVTFLNDGFCHHYSAYNSQTQLFTLTYRKVSYEGVQLWEIPQSASPSSNNLGKVIGTQDGNLLTVVRVDSSNLRWLIAKKYNSINGELIWSRQLTPKSASYTHHPYGIAGLPDGGFFTIGHINHPLTGNVHFLLKFDANGNFLWERKDYESLIPLSTIFSYTLATLDGNVLFAGSSGSENLLMKFDGDGNLLWQKTIELGTLNSEYLLELPSGSLLLASQPYSTVEGNHTVLKMLSKDGDAIWERLLDYKQEGYYWERVDCMTYLSSGELLLGGINSKIDTIPGLWNVSDMLVKADTFGNIYPHFINGHVFNDEALDCQFNGTEHPFADVVVKAESTDNTYYGISDAEGNFTLNLPGGSYNVSVSSAQYWESCQPGYTLEINPQNDTAAVTIPLQPTIFCPLLNVDLATPFMRNCTTGVYFVQYCNRGTTTAEGATLQIALAPELTYISSTGSLSAQSGQLLTFDLGNVQPFDCGGFTIQYNLECGMAEMGQTLCTEVHAFPDTPCFDEPYTGPIIEADGVCEGDSVKFIITNTGGDMSQPAEYIVIEDNIILLTNDFELTENQSIEQAIEAQSGSTYHLVAKQDPNLPPMLGYTVATASVEGCVGPVNEGFFNQILLDDAEPWLEIDCQQVISSFDPNDKTGFPTGLGEEHLIDEHTELDYLIRFQNTGTDTAFKVVILDTLSSFLDPSSIRPGASSHPYRIELGGQGVAKFIFENILLPDSTTNELGSHGFVKFKISQAADNQPGTLIENTAAIYFDHNAPVITNTTFHKISEPWVTVVNGSFEAVDEKIGVKIAPNPMNEWAIFEMSKLLPGENTLTILDALGREVLRMDFSNGSALLQRQDMNPGVYFFSIKNNGNKVGAGKLVVQ